MNVTVGDLPPTFTTQSARASGLHPRDLYKLRDRGEILELSRGVFRRADAPTPDWPDLLAVAYRSPVAVVCCVSALAVHDLTNEIPPAVQVAVPRPRRTPTIDHPPTQVFRFDTATFGLGLSTIEAAPGETVRVYNAHRTVVDLMRLRHTLGEPLAFAALQRYVRRRDARPGEVLDFARALDVLGPVRTALDIASAG
ncbi:type IV toxin-antitoxin system AbiEi family antitoxin domain-containing protein [Amycolatopsis sp. NPDC059657]|uniref:type IV toxin-antitoxin system AbiEi family antitoxin domain-containing protein n=1 Tax=Amycolatopsis sp. NPDC059657 TaxID=3346899 RepID=UPI00366CDCD4